MTGSGGVGRSTLAMALAAGLAADPRDAGLVVLADLALHAQQALLHDAGDVVPGVVELAEAYRGTALDAAEVRSVCFSVPGRGYDLLLGLRRHRDWTALRPRALAVALDGLRRAYRVVVSDVDPDVEGEAECGSLDVEDRNLLARTVLRDAEIVLVVGLPGLAGRPCAAAGRARAGRVRHRRRPDRARRQPGAPRPPAASRARGHAGGPAAGGRLPGRHLGLDPDLRSRSAAGSTSWCGTAHPCRHRSSARSQGWSGQCSTERPSCRPRRRRPNRWRWCPDPWAAGPSTMPRPTRRARSHGDTRRVADGGHR